MSINVLVIPEDFTKDQYVLKPIVERMMAEIGRPARVRVCTDPRLGGVGEALKWDRLTAIIERYRGMTQLFLLIVDRDCVAERSAKLEALEEKARVALSATGGVFLAENAWQEVEVWLLAGFKDLPKDWSWQQILEDGHPKEAYYDAYAEQRGVLKAPYEGREVLGREAAANYRRIRKLCENDVARLENRIQLAI